MIVDCVKWKTIFVSSGSNTLIRNLMRTSKRRWEREVIKLDGSSVSLFDKLNRDKVA